MIATLCSETATPERDVSQIDLEITGITFEGGNLSKPRYPSLIDHSRAPAGVQFEPGIQIRSGQRDLTFKFQIDLSSGVEFERDRDGFPRIESIGTGRAGLVAASLLDANTCQLTWRQSEAQSNVTALRLLCARQTPTNEDLVYGGVYLAIVNRPEQLVENIAGADPGLPTPSTIKILGTDAVGRPIYDLYSPQALPSLPSDLSLEPTFRVSKGEIAEFSMLFDLAPDEEIHFLPGPGGCQGVAVEPSQPAELCDSRSDDGKECNLQWVQGESLVGQVTSFLLVAHVGPEVTDPLKVSEGDKRRLIDPTVIQPPNCTSGGICN